MMVTSTDEILSAIQNAEKKLSAVYDEPQVETISTTLAVVSSLLLAAMLVTTVKFCQASASWEIVDVNRGLRRICGSLVSAVLSVLFVWCIIYPFGTWVWGKQLPVCTRQPSKLT